MAGTLAQAHIYTYYDNGSSVVVNNTCQACTSCNVQVSASGGNPTPTTNYVAYQWTLTGVCIPADRQVQIICDSFVVKNRFVVYANSSVIYDSGCSIGSSTATFNIPAGTSRVDLLIYGRCDGTGSYDVWSISLGCT